MSTLPSPAQLRAAEDALRAILRFDHPADAVLRAFFREHRQLGQRDRAWVAELTFAVVRHLRLLETLTGGREPHRLLLAGLAVLEGRSARQLDPLLAASDSEWLAQVRGADRTSLPLPVQLSLPDWVWERLLATRAPADAVTLARAWLTPAALDLRVNTLLASREQVLERFAADGIEAAATPFAPTGVRLPDKPALQHHPLFLEGKVEVQDEASQLLTWLVAPRRREMVVDFCAGAGGKTLALGAAMHSEGRLYAFDTSKARLANLAPRLKRSGLSNVHPQHIDSERDSRIKRLAAKIDRVLVDAPCSGLGTLRRNPDLKWRQSADGLAQLVAKQKAILAAAAQLVKPGGRLVYATCSVLREENEDVVASFLAAHPQFRSLHCGELLTHQGIALDTGEHLIVSPDAHGMDGFFAAAVERNSAQQA